MAIKLSDEYTVNVTFTREDMDKLAYMELATCAKRITESYYPHARFNLDKVFDDNAVMGLQVYRDYGLHVALVYPDYDDSYSSIGIADIYGDKVDYRYCYTGGHPELGKFLNKILTDKTIIEDYDRQLIEEAIELGDADMLEDVLGDRCLTEFI